ncbi:conserved hypothetical protein [Candidatus Desulfarcum epimagneticum]|uniref:ParB/Sulfiredoxin domain-containing protein n=1 Tax=uncultured Desulfobacteraceae bacterium TaxID=218296 RepID=A0A484HFR7_9BACT|nr:conserved hypothetical protein [uncultured Desulfobacteraceae bacterium]
MKTNHQKIEISRLELRYIHTRIRDARAELKMCESLDRHGQILPVLVVSSAQSTYILIDGYLRIAALKRCGRDRVWAKFFKGGPKEALIYILARGNQRRRDILEEACLIRELIVAHKLSQVRISKLLGRDQSWVSRRLLFLNALPDTIIRRVQAGGISSWAAQRVLAPMARANSAHADILADHLAKEKIGTRDLAQFFEHYKKSVRKKRQDMIENPGLFLKALHAKREDGAAKELSAGPEGRWRSDMNATCHILERAIRQAPNVICRRQSNLDRRTLLTPFEQARQSMSKLNETIMRLTDDIQRIKTNSSGHAGKRLRHTGNRADIEDIQEYGSPGDPKKEARRAKAGQVVS